MVVSSWGKPENEAQNQNRLRDKELPTLKSLLENTNFEGTPNPDFNVYLDNLLLKINENIRKIIESRPPNLHPNRKPNSWYDRSLAKLKNKKERQYKVYLSNPCQTNKTLYTQKKQIYEKKLLEKKNEFSTGCSNKKARF